MTGTAFLRGKECCEELRRTGRRAPADSPQPEGLPSAAVDKRRVSIWKCFVGDAYSRVPCTLTLMHTCTADG